MQAKKFVNDGIYLPEYTFNAALFASLSKHFRVKSAHIADTIGVNRVTFHRWQKNGDCKLDDLLRLCNMFCIRVSSFIAPDDNFKNVSVQANKGGHFNFVFNASVVCAKFTNEIPMTEAQKLLKCRWSSVQSWSSEDAMVSNFLRLCNTLRWNIGDLISDNTIDPISMDMTRNEMELEIIRLRREIERMNGKSSNRMVAEPYVEYNIRKDEI